MAYGVNSRIVIALTFVFALVVSGCLQSGYSSKCDRITQITDKDDCVEYMAVWYQDPYTCYDVRDSTKRESCLERSVTPKEARLLQAQKESEQRAIEVIVEEKKIETKIIAEPTDSGLNAQVKRCMDEEGFSVDGCTHKVAIANSDITMCETISSENYRRPCISNIALASKNQDVCNKLVRADDKQLCMFYAGSG